MAAIDGLPSVSSRDMTPWPRRANARAVSGVSADSSEMSAPATKARSPAPVTIRLRTSRSLAAPFSTLESSSRTAWLNAFSAFGRFTVIRRTGPSRSTISVWCDIA
jgi:hypothetical protein